MQDLMIFKEVRISEEGLRYLLDTLDKIHIKSFISGPIPAVDRGIN